MNRLFAGIISISVLMNTGFVFAEDKVPEKPWKSVTEGSLTSTNGNSDATTMAGKETFTYTKSKTTMELMGAGLGSSSNGVQTAEKYSSSEKVSYKVSDRNYVFEKYEWNKDRFAGIRNRHDVNGGLGREIWKTDWNLLIAEIGGGHISEERVNEKTNNFDSGRFYSKYTYTISKTSSFSQDAEYLHNFDNPDDFRVNTDTSLLAALSSHLALKVSYIWNYVGEPPTGRVRSDTTTLVSLVATY